MLPGKKYRPEDFVWIAWRRKWVIVVPAVLVTFGTAAVAKRLPDRYRSEAVMVVVPQRVPDSYVRSVVGQTGAPPRIEDRVQALRQQVTSRTRLEAIIQEFDLYRDLRRRLAMEDVVESMRSDIEVQVVRGDAFRVSYTTGDPKTAQKVAERVASQFNEENLRERSGLAEQTTEFLQSQLDEARRRLTDHEQKLALYKEAHAGQLPSERDATLQVLSSTQLQVQNVVESINRDHDRHLFLERLLADLEAEVAQSPAAPAPAVPGADPTAVIGVSAAAQLEGARSQLRVLELKLKPEHPDIIRLKRVIKDLEAKAQAEELQKPLTPSPQPQRALTQDETNRRNRIRDTRAELASLDVRIQTSQAEERRLRNLVASYEGRLAAMPGRESELTSLMRDYDTLSANYRSLLVRQEDSKVAANLERRQIGEQFRMIDAPRVPERPFTPNRQMINLMGVAVGLALGLGLAVLLEYRDTSFRTDDDVVTALALPVLAVVPRMLTSAERRRLRRRRRVLSILGAACGLLFAGAVLAWKLGALSGLL